MPSARVLVVLAVSSGCLLACRDEPAAKQTPAIGSAPSGPAAGAPPAPPPAQVTLKVVARFSEPATLVAGTRRIAVSSGKRWLEAGDDRTLREVAKLGAAVAATRDQMEGDVVGLFLGATPIVFGGDDHREHAVRLDPAPRKVALAGGLREVAAWRDGSELWLYDAELRARLATVAGAAVTELPPLPLAGAAPAGMSPVGAKVCATPAIVDLTGNGELIGALVVECDLAAAVRIASFRKAGPDHELVDLGSRSKLGLEPEQLALSRGGSFAVAGRVRGALAIARLGRDGRVGGPLLAGPGPASKVIDLAIADDDAAWALTLGSEDRSDVWIVSREGVRAVLEDAALRPRQLALDDRLGVVVLAAAAGGGAWALLAERAP